MFELFLIIFLIVCVVLFARYAKAFGTWLNAVLVQFTRLVDVSCRKNEVCKHEEISEKESVEK